MKDKIIPVIIIVMITLNVLGTFVVHDDTLVIIYAIVHIIAGIIALARIREEDNGWMKYYDNFAMPIVEFARDGTVVNCNKAFKSLSGTENNLFKIAIPSRCDDECKNLADMIQTNNLTSIETTLAFQSNYVAILNIIQNSYVPKYFLGFMTDITEFKNLETQFYHAQKMQAIGQLAGGIAHDFNNIMTTVLGACDLLLMRHTASDESFVGIKQIQQNAIRAINLVKQLLAFSRKQILQPSLINISEVLDELSNNLIRRLIGENIVLKLQLDRNQWLIKADESQFEQIIINLAVNARDAMPNGGTLTIRTKYVKIDDSDPLFIGGMKAFHLIDFDQIKSGEYILIEVEDTGIGIPDDQISKIFDPFYSTKPLSVGSGLGLSTVYGIVKQTGGYIYVSSELGVGATFYILFKSAGSASDEHIQYSEKKLEDGTEEIMDLTGTETIMIVEDEMHVRTLCVQALRNKGYNVFEADSCETALEMFREHSDEISLIITDIVMSGMNGPDLAMIAEQIKPGIKVILISGYTEDILLHTSNGIRTVLPKPFTLKKLAAVVRQSLSI